MADSNKIVIGWRHEPVVQVRNLGDEPVVVERPSVFDNYQCGNCLARGPYEQHYELVTTTMPTVKPGKRGCLCCGCVDHPRVFGVEVGRQIDVGDEVGRWFIG